MNLVLAATLASATAAAPAAERQAGTASAQPVAQPGGVIILTNPELADGFMSRRACEQALGDPGNDPRSDQGKATTARLENSLERSGSAFNRSRGNMSRCELVDGEYLILVIPGA